MIASVLFIAVIQYILKLNFISFLPNSLIELLNLKKIGVDSLFLFLFNIFEILSVLKNMILCGLPIPKKLQYYLEKLLEEYTSEIKERGN